LYYLQINLYFHIYIYLKKVFPAMHSGIESPPKASNSWLYVYPSSRKSQTKSGTLTLVWFVGKKIYSKVSLEFILETVQPFWQESEKTTYVSSHNNCTNSSKTTSPILEFFCCFYVPKLSIRFSFCSEHIFYY
jgi:hypothetical protein